METDCKNEICAEIETSDGFNLETDSNVFEFDVEMVVWIVVHAVLLVFIIGGNLLTIIAVRICRRLRAIVSNLFILSLAVSDLIVGLTLPYHLSFFLGLGLGKSKCLCILRFCIIIFACCISMWNLISIAIDRYIAIMYPLHYRRFITRRVAVFVIALGWIVGSLLACIPIFCNNWDRAKHCEFNEILPAWYILGIITPVFSLVWICLLFVYLRIWQEATKQAKQLQTATCCQYLPSDSKSVQVVLLIMGAFTICWLPYFTVACLQIFVTFDACPIMYRAALALAMSNSAFNPIIYAWKNSNFRRSFCRLLQCKSPNCISNNDYSVWEHCPRNGSQGHVAAEISCTPFTTPTTTTTTTGSRPRTGSQESTKAVINCNPDPRNSIDSSEINGQFVFNSTSGNRLPVLEIMSNETYISAKAFCLPCEVCNILAATKTNSKMNLNGFVVPWKCREYSHKNIINTIKCRW